MEITRECRSCDLTQTGARIGGSEQRAAKVRQASALALATEQKDWRSELEVVAPEPGNLRCSLLRTRRIGGRSMVRGEYTNLIRSATGSRPIAEGLEVGARNWHDPEGGCSGLALDRRRIGGRSDLGLPWDQAAEELALDRRRIGGRNGAGSILCCAWCCASRPIAERIGVRSMRLQQVTGDVANLAADRRKDWRSELHAGPQVVARGLQRSRPSAERIGGRSDGNSHTLENSTKLATEAQKDWSSERVEAGYDERDAEGLEVGTRSRCTGTR